MGHNVTMDGASDLPDDARPRGRKPSRIQARNRAAILAAGLDEFSERGFDGATLDRIARAAALSKPNLLYYFPSKEAVHLALLEDLLDLWLAPLRTLDPDGDPIPEVLAYVRRKLDLSRDFPRESRLFAGEVLRGAPHLGPILRGPLADLVTEKSATLDRWMDEGRLARVSPQHLLFSIWALTQHYADFDVQVRAVLGDGHDPYAEAGPFLDTLMRRLLAP